MSGRPRRLTDKELKDTNPALQALTDAAASRGVGTTGTDQLPLTEQEAIHILTEMVRQGMAGPAAPQFIKAVLEIRASSGAAIGPPPPTNEQDTYERLRRIFAFASQPALDRAYADHVAARAAPSPDPGPEAPAEAPLPPETTGTSEGNLE